MSEKSNGEIGDNAWFIVLLFFLIGASGGSIITSQIRDSIW